MKPRQGYFHHKSSTSWNKSFKRFLRKRTCRSICIDKKIQQEFEQSVLEACKDYAHKIRNWRNESANSTETIV